jgi:hypothetical protein
LQELAQGVEEEGNALSGGREGRYFGRVQYRNQEDRLNPITPPGVDDTTLGGYPAVHGRAAAFEGSDGEPYTVAVDTEDTAVGETPWVAYLVFLRWSQTGSAVMGHLETEDLARGATEVEARSVLEALPLPRVKEILDATIARKKEDESQL